MKRFIAVALACVFVFPAGLWAQGSLRDAIAREATRAALTATQATEPQGAWNAVLALKPDAPIKLMTRDGRKIVGSFASADANSIVVGTRRGRHQTLRRDEIKDIRMRPRRSTLGSLGIGALSGFGLGAALGWIADSSGPSSDDPQGIVLGGAFGFAVGSWIGLGVGAVRNLRPGELIYRAPV